MSTIVVMLIAMFTMYRISMAPVSSNANMFYMEIVFCAISLIIITVYISYSVINWIIEYDRKTIWLTHTIMGIIILLMCIAKAITYFLK